MAPQYSFALKELSKTVLNGKKILDNIWLSFYHGAKIGVLGPNGSGKSTLLKIMAGVEKEFQGERWAAADVKIGYLPQEPQLDESKTVLENIMGGLSEQQALLDRFDAVNEKLCEDIDDATMSGLYQEQADLQAKIDACDAWNLKQTAEIAMDSLRCPPGESPVKTLSGGEKRRVALCRLLLEKPNMLLLDEPTNHLDAESVAWLETFLETYPGTVVIITHDRYFLDNVTGWILELDRGKGIPYEGNYTAWLEQKQKRLAQEEKEEAAQQKQLARELEWVQQSPKARHAKSKARLQAYETLLAQSNDKQPNVAQIVIPAGPRLGDLVIEAQAVNKSFGDRLLIENLSFNLPRGGIVGIIGPNGAGKTTLFKMIMERELPDAGEFKIGASVKLGYIDQSRDALDANKTVWEEISGGMEEILLGRHPVKSRAYCASFNFKGQDQQKKVNMLSGGERNRLHFAKMLKSGANVLLLDEPTNDLDVETLRALEEALLEFAGCAVVISHDRWFLDRVATHILAFEGDSHVEWFEGNYQDYEADLKRRKGNLTPRRLKFKEVSR